MTSRVSFALLFATSLAGAAEPETASETAAPGTAAPETAEAAPGASTEANPDADATARGYEPDQHGVTEDCPPDSPGCSPTPDEAAVEEQGAEPGYQVASEEKEVLQAAVSDRPLRLVLAARVGLGTIDFSSFGDSLTGVADAHTGLATSLGVGLRLRSHLVRVDYEHGFFEDFDTNAALLRYRWAGLGSRWTLRLGANAGYAWLGGAEVPVSGPTFGAELGVGWRLSRSFELGTGLDAGVWFVESDPPNCPDCRTESVGHRAGWYLEGQWNF